MRVIKGNNGLWLVSVKNPYFAIHLTRKLKDNTL